MTLSEIFKMNCQQATLLCEKQSEGKITLLQRVGVWLHFAHCSLCRLFLKQTEIISKETKTLGNTSHTLDSSAKNKIAQSLNKKIKGDA